MKDTASTMEPGADFCIDGWLVRPSRGTVRRDGKEQRLKPKVMAVLQCLAQARGEVVTRAELFDAVWPGGVVSDATLSQCIVELRQAFGESAKDPHLIETIPKVGFRLTCAVVEPAESPPRSKPTKPWIWAGLATAALLLGILIVKGATNAPAGNEDHTIAVLPFVDMSPDQDQGHFADGLTEQLIHDLSQIEGLEVTARTSSFMFKNRNEDLREIARILGVRHLLEGSIQKSGGQVRVTANLVDASTATPVWSETYEREAVDYFALQDEIAKAVTAATGIGIGVAPRGHVFGTRSIEAYEEAMKAYAGKIEFSSEAAIRSIEHLRRATEIDPDYAFAWGAMANFYVVYRDGVSADWQTQAAMAFARSEELAPDDPMLIGFSVFKHVAFEEWAEAERALAKLSEAYRTSLVPQSLELLLKVGRVDAAIEQGERMLIRDPLGDDARIWLAHAYALAERYDEALEASEFVWELYPDAAAAQEGLITALNSGDQEQIDKWLSRMLQYPEVQHIYLPMAEHLHDRESSLHALRQLEPTISAEIYPAAMWAAYWDDPELAMYFMRMLPDPWAIWMPHNAGLRQLPEFKRLVTEMGLVDYWREFGWNDFCRPQGEDDFVCR